MKKWKKIAEEGFAGWARWIYRHPWPTLGAVLVVLAALCAQLPRGRLDMSIEGFFRQDDPAWLDYNAFRDQFGRDETMLVVLSPPKVFEPGFLRKLRSLHTDLEREVPHLEDVTSLLNARETRGDGDRLHVGELMEDWPNTAEQLAVLETRVLANPLYRNTLISEDGRLTTLVLRTVTYSDAGATPAGADEDLLAGFDAPSATGGAAAASAPPVYLSEEEKAESVAAVQRVLARYAAPDFPIHLAGASPINTYLNKVVHGDLFQLGMLAMVAIGLLLLLLFRRASGIALPLLIVLSSLLATIALLATLGITLKMSAAQLPSFLVAVGVADSVHILTLFYRELDRTGDKEGALVAAFAHSGIPVVLTSLTTAIGLGSFATARLATTAEFGWYSAFGVLCALLLTLLLLPATISLLPIRPRPQQAARPGAAWLDRALTALGATAVSRPWTVLLGAAALAVVGLLGATQIRYSQDAVRWLPADQPLRQSSELVDRELKGSVSAEVVVDTGRENGLYEPATQAKLAQLARFAESYRAPNGRSFVGPTLSVADVLAEINQALNENRSEAHVIPSTRELVGQELLLFENAGSDDLEDLVDSRFSKARFSARVPYGDAVEFVTFVDELDRYAQKLFGPQAKVTTTGLLTLLTEAFLGMIASMTTSYLVAGIAIALMMVLLLGSLRLGLLSMIPNLIPIVMTLGVMGWLDLPMDTITILIGSIAIGLVVDDTIHFMHAFRGAYEQSGDVGAAVRETLLTTGRAMAFTSLGLVAGFLVFLSATLSLMVNFGALLALTIVFALVADVLVTPALLTLVFREARNPTGAIAAQRSQS